MLKYATNEVEQGVADPLLRTGIDVFLLLRQVLVDVHPALQLLWEGFRHECADDVVHDSLRLRTREIPTE